MKLFRNPEILKSLGILGVLSVLAVGAAFMVDSSFGLFTLGLCLVFALFYVVTTYRRYQKIAELSADIDRLLHQDIPIKLDAYAEGELAILQSEVQKMTVRLREQQQSLREDKIYLADSIADISHQIRTPLTSINLLVSFLAEPNLSESRKTQLLHELGSLLGRIDWLIVSLLKISKLDAGTVQFKTEKTALADLIKSSAEPLLVPMELKEQTLTVKAEGDFYGDRLWTQEAVTNIVKNCMEHTPMGGEISVTAQDNALFTEIIIRDNGCGIGKEDLPHIFQRFYKGKNSGGNSFGIGLALARTIVTSQNGTLKAENNPDGGAKFTIRFYKGTV